MTAPADISLHRAARYIDEDLEYYFTDRRDKHNQIRPRDDIAPHVPEARPDARAPSRAQPGSLFHPYPRHALHRIFIGISFPLYSNSWGAAFLRYLLELLRPGGAIILPVYPELQAHEKGLWCRSSLESVFRSRRRLVGMSNIWAENDGVMSLRVGRKWPPVIASTARALWQQAPRAAWRCALQADAGAAAEAWRAACARHWRCAQMSAVGEQILRDRFGARRRLRIAAHGADAGLLMLELLFSPYLRVRRARAHGALEDRAELEGLRALEVEINRPG